MATVYGLLSSTLERLGDAMRNHFLTNDTFTPLEMINKLNELEGNPVLITIENISHINSLTDEWERPNDWPDIDALADEIEGDLDCVYFTYDLAAHSEFHWIGIYVTMWEGDTWYLDRYDEGEFVHTHLSASASQTIIYDLNEEPDNNTKLVWRLTSNGHIKYFGFASNSTINYLNNYLPCIERTGTLPWCELMGQSTGSFTVNGTCGSTIWLEHDGIIFGKNVPVKTLAYTWKNSWRLLKLDTYKWNTDDWTVNSLDNTWTFCYNLRKLNLNTLDTSNWNVATLASTWAECNSLLELNINNLDTSNWAVTSLNSTWLKCYSLKELNINNWNTTNWAVTTLTSTWDGCYSLVELNLNNWNTSNWIVDSLSSTWLNCWGLYKLKIENWDTSNWPVTKLTDTWHDCHNLKKLNLNKWNTENWGTTTISLASAWCNCYNLQELKINTWNTLNWKLNTLNTAWQNCYSLASLNLNNWNTSSWIVTTLSGTWQNCYSLIQLNIDEWDTSNWAVTNLNSTWTYCYSLKQLNIDEWDTSNWAVTLLLATWSNCYSLKQLNINEWDTSNWAVTNMQYTWLYCRNLKVLNIEDWDTSNWDIGSGSDILREMNTLEVCLLPASIPSTNSKINMNPTGSYLLSYYSGFNNTASMNFSYNSFLTRASLLSIFNRLPNVQSKTLTLGTINLNKLTAEDKAIATNKGWTLA